MKSKSLKLNAFFNMLRTTLNIIFPLITFPYITRILSPEGIGIIEFSRSISNYFILIAALGITQYAIREGAPLKDNKKKLQVFSSEIFTFNLVSALFSIVLLIITLTFSKELNIYSHIIYIFCLQIIFDAISVEWLYTLEEDFIYITVRSFIFQIISVLLMFIFVKSKDDYILYVLITTLSLGGSYIFNFINSKKYISLKINFHFFKHFKPVCILFVNNIASTIYLNSDITILGILSSDYQVGIYSTGVKIYTIVKKMTNAILMSMIPRLSSYYSNNDIKSYDKLVNELFWTMIMLIVPSSFGLISLREPIVYIIAGPSFRNSSTSLMVLSIGLIFSVMSAFFIYGVLLVQKKEHKILKVTLISAVINVFLNFLTIPILNEIGAAISTVLCEVFVVIYSFKVSSPLIKLEFDKNKLISIITGSLGILLICYLILSVLNNSVLIVLASVFFSAIYYFGILKFMNSFPEFE